MIRVLDGRVNWPDKLCWRDLLLRRLINAMTRNCKTIAQNHLSQSKLVFGLHDISCVMRFEAAKAARSARASDSSCFHCFESIKTDAHAQSPKDRWSMNDFWVTSWTILEKKSRTLYGTILRPILEKISWKLAGIMQCRGQFWSLHITNFLNQDRIPVNHPFSVLFLHPSAVTRLRLHSQPWAKLLQVLLTALSSWAAAVQHYKWMDATERQTNI